MTEQEQSQSNIVENYSEKCRQAAKEVSEFLYRIGEGVGTTALKALGLSDTDPEN